MNLKTYYTIEQARRVLLYKSKQMLNNLCADSKVTCVRFGRSWLFDRQSVDTLADASLEGEALTLSLAARQHAEVWDVDSEEWQPLKMVLEWYPYTRQRLFQRVKQAKVCTLDAADQTLFSVADVRATL